MDYTMKAYGNTWMLRYCTLDQWKDAIQYAMELVNHPRIPSDTMFKELKYAYKATRPYLQESPRFDDMVAELDALFRI